MQKLSQAVPQRAAIIKDAKTMSDLLVENFSHPAASSFNACMKSAQLNWHVFFYVLVTGEGAVQQNRPGCHFKTLKGIRKLLCVKSLPQQEKLLVRFVPVSVNCLMDDRVFQKCWRPVFSQAMHNSSASYFCYTKPQKMILFFGR